MTKLFQVKLRAYGHMADFNIEAEDSAESIELAILDKIGKAGYCQLCCMVIRFYKRSTDPENCSKVLTWA